MNRKKVVIIIVSIIIFIMGIIAVFLIKTDKKELDSKTTTTINDKSTKPNESEENTSANKKTTEQTKKEEITKNTTTKKNDSNSSITTSDKNNTTNKSTTSSNKGTTNKNTTTTKKTTTTVTTKKTITTTKKTTTSSVDEVDSLRKKIENTYGIKIKYGNEIGNYKPKRLTPTKMTDKDTITKRLRSIDNEFKKYPTGFFREFSGMPLTIFLVTSVPGNSFAGFTDKEFMNDIKITLTEHFLFEYTLNHEIMHYIDAYLEIKMYPNNPYDEYTRLNPSGYQYGNTIRSYTYGYNGKIRGAYFLSDYAQYNVREDRAELFKQMVTKVYKPAGMFDEGETLQKKALVIDKQIRDNFRSAKGTLYWDKYIK